MNPAEELSKEPAHEPAQSTDSDIYQKSEAGSGEAENSSDDPEDTPQSAEEGGDGGGGTPPPAGDDAATTSAPPGDEDSEGSTTSPTQTVFTTTETYSSTTVTPFKIKRLSKMESADLYMYGPREDDIRVPDERPPAARTGDVRIRTNRAQELRQAHINKLTEEKVAHEKEEARLNRLKKVDMPTQNAYRRRLLKKRLQKLQELNLLNKITTTVIPEGLEMSSTAITTTAEPGPTDAHASAAVTTIEKKDSSESSDSSDAVTDPPTVEEGAETTIVTGVPDGEDTAEASTTSPSTPATSETEEAEATAGKGGSTTPTTTAETTTTGEPTTDHPGVSPCTGFPGYEREMSLTDLGSDDDEEMTSDARVIPRSLYNPPIIEVRETTSSKFRFLWNRKPQGIHVYFKLQSEAVHNAPRKLGKHHPKGPVREQIHKHKIRKGKPHFVVAGPPSKCCF